MLSRFSSLPALFFFFYATAASAAPPRTVSYHRNVWPMLQAHCQACHQPASAGGKLVVITYADFMKGGEHGVEVRAGHPETSPLLEYLTGVRTLMPKGGPALAPAEIATFRKWIAQGAHDDTPAEIDPIDAAHPPVYHQPPVVTALAYSPDGRLLAVSGYREVLLLKADGSHIEDRCIGKAQDIESVAFSPDGRLLAAAGGSPARFGDVQFWDVASGRLVRDVRSSYDTEFGAAFSPDGKELAFGCADNSARVITVPDGKQLLKFDNHGDWVFATAFSADGQNLLSASRDEAIKLTQISSGQFIDDINTHTGPVRSLVPVPALLQLTQVGQRRFEVVFNRDPLKGFGRGAKVFVHVSGAGATAANDVSFPVSAAAANASTSVSLPADVKDGTYDLSVRTTAASTGGESVVAGTLTVADSGKTLKLQPDQVISGGADQVPRQYRVFRTEARTMNMEDHNLIREYERQPGAITALAVSRDGSLVAVGSESEVVNVYSTIDGRHIASLRGHRGAIYALAFRPDGQQLAAGGFDGLVRLYALPGGALIKAFSAAPLQPATVSRQTARH